MHRFLYFLLSIVLVGFFAGGGQPVWAQGQEKQVWKNPAERIKINDDLSYIYQQDESSALTVINIMVKGGKRAVPDSLRGLAYLTTRLAIEMPTLEIVKQVMQMGSRIYYHVEGDYSTIMIESLSENLEETLKIVTKMMKKPPFSGLRIDNGKSFMAHRQKSEEDDPEKLMELTLLNSFFTSYAGSIYGCPDSLKNIKRKTIADFYDRFFNYSNMVILAATNLPKPEMTAIIKQYFESFPTGEPCPFEPVRVSVPGKKEIFLKKENQQVLISLGALLPGVSRKHYAMIYMLENLLGKGIGCKLWPLRANQELAYSLNTRFTQLREAGLLTIFLKTGTAKKAEAQKALKDIIFELYRQGISEDDLASTKVRSQADFLRENETKERRSQQMAYFEAMGIGFGFMEDFFSQVDQVSLEEFNGYLKQVLNPEQLLEVVIGPE